MQPGRVFLFHGLDPCCTIVRILHYYRGVSAETVNTLYSPENYIGIQIQITISKIPTVNHLEPTGAPKFIRSKILSLSRGFELHWEPPAPGTLNGEFMGYRYTTYWLLTPDPYVFILYPNHMRYVFIIKARKKLADNNIKLQAVFCNLYRHSSLLFISYLCNFKFRHSIRLNQIYLQIWICEVIVAFYILFETDPKISDFHI